MDTKFPVDTELNAIISGCEFYTAQVAKFTRLTNETERSHVAVFIATGEENLSKLRAANRNEGKLLKEERPRVRQLLKNLEIRLRRAPSPPPISPYIPKRFSRKKHKGLETTRKLEMINED